jgi:hypothetical protein
MFDQWEREQIASISKRMKSKSKSGGGVDPDLTAEGAEEICMEAEPGASEGRARTRAADGLG